MDSALLFFAFLWSLLGRGSSPAAPAAPATRPEQLPSGGTVSTPPWPQVLPPGLPPFPGSGWEFDEPPPAVVQQRAGQLLSSLWARGSGTHKIEQTAGRWIAYQAQIVASGKRGVVAYREKKRAALPAGASAVATRRAPSSPSSPATPTGYVPGSVHPGHATPLPPSSRAAPQVAPSSPLKLPILRYGAGLKPQAPVSEVRLLQQRLGIDADGRFGNGTRAKVSEFQRQRGLVVDGVVGPETWSALFASTATRA